MTMTLSECLEPIKAKIKVQRGWSPQCLVTPVTSENGWGVLKTTAIQMGRFEPHHNKELPATLEPKTHLEVQQGDFLMTTTGPRNRCGVVCYVRSTPPRLIFSGKILRFRVNEEMVDPRWIEYILLSPEYQKVLDRLKVGTSDSSVSIGNDQVLSLNVPVPPLAIQKKIVETLENHLSRLDKALTEAQYSAQATMRFSASLLHSMFTGDLMQRELGITELNLTALSEVAEVQSGGTPKGLERLSSESATGDHNVPFYKVGDMNLDPRYMKEARSYLTPKDVEALRLKVIPVGSVVFPKAGGAIATDKKRLVKVPGPIDLNCMAVIPGSAVLPSYLAWWFESFKLSDLSNGSILPQIGKTAVMQVQLPIPSISDQERVVQYLEENISMVRSQALSIDGVVASVSTLRRSVLNDAFSGKLVDRY
jgi:restriction endonuclease S subunit